MSSASPSPHRSLLSIRDDPSQHLLNLRGDPSQHPEQSTGTILLGGQISNETAGRLRESLHSPPPPSIEDMPLLNTYDRGGMDIDKVALEAQRREHAARPWWRRASAIWWIIIFPF